MMTNIDDTAKAISALVGMREIVENEMLVRGEYVTPVVNKELAETGAVCGGRKYCAIGSLWAGYGIQPRLANVNPSSAWADFPVLDGAIEKATTSTYSPWNGVIGRSEFLAEHPALALALDHLDAVAKEFAEANDLTDDIDPEFSSIMEGLFESTDDHDLSRNDLLDIINEAIARLSKVAVA